MRIFAAEYEKIMALHNEFGRSGEERAVDFLQEKGYFIRDRNWRNGHRELDIVAQKEDELVFVEVKTRRTSIYGHPSEAVSPLKIRRTVLAADAYLKCYRLDMRVRFDVIAIVGTEPHLKIEHIEDAFRSPVWYK